MPILHLLLIMLIVFIWGINFIFVKIGLSEMSPLFMCAARFVLVSVPAVFFVKRPSVSLKFVAAYGFFMFALQFSLIFIGMHVGMTPGMASLIMQVQVFFSMFFAMLIFGEQPLFVEIFGALVSFSGIALVAFHFDNHVSLIGFLCVLGSAASLGVGNLFAKKMKTNDIISVIVWSSLIVSLPMLIVAWVVEGSTQIISSLEHLTWKGVGALFYIVYLSTWVGYGTWNWLLGKHPVSTVVPFTLLIPIVGIVGSVFIFDESFQSWKLTACLLVIGGLCINILSSRLMRRQALRLCNSD